LQCLDNVFALFVQSGWWGFLRSCTIPSSFLILATKWIQNYKVQKSKYRFTFILGIICNKTIFATQFSLHNNRISNCKWLYGTNSIFWFLSQHKNCQNSITVTVHKWVLLILLYNNALHISAHRATIRRYNHDKKILNY
jgi:hypothetical protein